MPISIDPFTLLLISCIPGSLCAYGATKRGRRSFIWFAIGVVFGFLGLLALYLLPKKQHSSPLKPSPYSFPTPDERHELWHYLNKAAQAQGPMSTYALCSAWTKREIDASTYVWNEKMSDWKRVSDLPDLFGHLKKDTKKS